MRKLLMVLPLLLLAAVAQAQNTTVDTLTSQITAAASSASSIFYLFCSIAVASFVVGALIAFARRGKSPR